MSEIAWSDWANAATTLLVGVGGIVFVARQNKILADQNRIFERQKEYNNLLIEIQNRQVWQRRLVNRVMHADEDRWSNPENDVVQH